jgi:cell division septal protein FtsQ
VVISIEERRPFTLVHAGRLHWIDEEGVAFGAERRAVSPDSPVVTGLTPEEVAAMRLAPSPKARIAIELIRAMRGAHPALLGEISEIDVGGAEGPVLYTLDSVEVRLGTDDWDARLARLEGVLGQIAATGQPVRSIDLRFRDQVVLKGGTP